MTGPGGPREDRVQAMLSPGEFVVNADATKKNRELLYAINSGAYLPPRAPSGASDGSQMSTRTSTVNLNVNYPQASDPLRDAQEWADLVGAGANV